MWACKNVKWLQTVYSVVWYTDFTQALFTVKMTRASLVNAPVEDWPFCNLPPPALQGGTFAAEKIYLKKLSSLNFM